MLITVVPAIRGCERFEATDASVRRSRALAEPLHRPELRRPWQGAARGFLADAVVPLRVVSDRRGLTVGLPENGELRVRVEGQTIQVEAECAEDSILQHALAGPGLCLALATRGIACLHASAATAGDRVVVFLGESGVGKSTLARALSTKPGWRLVADDCLPTALSEGTDGGGPAVLFARPRFPQLKLTEDEQWPADAPAELPIVRLYELRDEGADVEEVTQRRLSRREASLALVRHTSASRLYPPELLSWQLNWVSEVTEGLGVSRLLFPRRLEALPRVVEAIERDLEEDPAPTSGRTLCPGRVNDPGMRTGR